MCKWLETAFIFKALIIAPYTLNNNVNIDLTFGSSRGKTRFSDIPIILYDELSHEVANRNQYYVNSDLCRLRSAHVLHRKTAHDPCE